MSAMVQATGLGKQVLSGDSPPTILHDINFTVIAGERLAIVGAATGARVIELMSERNRAQGMTLLPVAHDDALTRHCDRRLRLNEGGWVQ